MFRANNLHPKTTLTFTKPKAADPRELLGAIGYYDYSEARAWTRTGTHTRDYWKHRRGIGVDTLAAKELIEYLPGMEKGETYLLFEALVEGMQNASEWGYGGRESGYRSWWLLGHKDQSSGEVSFCFFDQGVGIPRKFERGGKIAFPL